MTYDRDELARLRAQVDGLKDDLAASREKHRQLRSRRSVRIALKVADLASPIVRFARRLGLTSKVGSAQEAPGVAQKRPNRRAQSRLARRVASGRSGVTTVTGPMVSIVVLTRDGAEHLRRLFRGLDRTTYRPFEVIVVDNGSIDSTVDVLAVERPYPTRVVRNEENVSFSKGNNQGADLAQGELLLVLNNDVEPINPGWLGAMVQAMTGGEDVVAVGALLVFPSRGDPETDLTVQHRGIHFGFRLGAVRAFNSGGPDPLDPQLLEVLDVPAVTAAAMLLRRTDFVAVGGFDERYVYGREDVDLCLKLRDSGRIVMAGKAALFHYESATMSQVGAEVREASRAKNRRLFAEIWSPRLTRSVVRDRLTAGRAWTVERPRTVAITLTHDQIDAGWGDYYTAHELGEAFAADGWRVVYAERYLDHWYDIDEDVDLVISLLDSYDVRRKPEGAFSVAWVRNWVDRWLEQPWFDAYDLIAVSSQMGADAISLRSRHHPSVVHMATNSTRFKPGAPNPLFEADFVFTGNNWGFGRDLIRLLDVHGDERFMIFGKGWERDPRAARYWRGHLGYELLPDVYRSTKIVLDDTATPTLPYAFLNGRVFDALASGALVLTDNAEGSDEVFGGMLPTYSGAENLRKQLDRYLGNERERLELVGHLREKVLLAHSYTSRPRELLDLALGQLDRPHAAIKIPVPKEEVKAQWGDTHFGEALASALTRLGMPTTVHILPEWEHPANQAVDVVIHIRGLTRYTPKPAHVNVLWIISHPDDISVRECEKYDLILVASRSFADWLRPQVEVPVAYLPQATDSRRFRPVERDEDLGTEVLFVGNSRGQRRPAVDWAIEAGLPLAVYGEGWEGLIPDRYVRATHFPNEDLARLYASANVVLNDHWPDMRERGFISNRIFDALASGTVVLSDRVVGLEETFGELVPTFGDRDELEELAWELLKDVERRAEIVESAARLVAHEHTFEQRSERLVEILRPLVLGRPSDLDGGILTL